MDETKFQMIKPPQRDQEGDHKFQNHQTKETKRSEEALWGFPLQISKPHSKVGREENAYNEGSRPNNRKKIKTS